MIHLDTGFLIQALQPGSKQERRLLAWLTGSQQVCVSAFAWSEFLCGPLPPEAADAALKVLGEPVPLDRQAAERAAALFNAAGRRRGSLGDCLIAAAAMEAGARLATDNTRDFDRFVKMGLALAD
jgi:predicted nucleic acid-binding protein